MKLSSILLFLSAFALAPVAAEHEFHTCDYNEYDLNDGGTKVGFIQVFDDIMFLLEVKVEITADAPEFTLITRVYGSACCPDGTQCIDFEQVVTPSTDVTLSNVEEPMCGEGKIVDLTVNADLQTGGIAAFNAMFDPAPSVEFWVTLADADTDPSYLDVIITNTAHPQLEGKRLDAYCIDVNTNIRTGENNVYTGKLYSYLDAMQDGTQIPNVANPDRLDSVAYCINAYIPGVTTWDVDGSTLSSSTLQRAIWYVLGDGQSTGGLGFFNEIWALEIADDCLNNGEGFVPGCNDMIPLVVRPQGAQNLYAQTLLSALDISCRPGSATAAAQALCEPNSKNNHGGGFGDPHFLSWTGELFDFQGACDVVLAQSETFGHGLGMAAHLRLAGRYDYSFIESAAVQIGEDIFEVGAWGAYVYNGIETARLPKTMGNGKYTVDYAPTAKEGKHYRLKNVQFEIKEGAKTIITLGAHKDLVSLRFHREEARNFFDAEGLMGDFYHGRHLARDGKTVIEDVNEFGQEWQVRPGVDKELFASPHENQYPKKCVIPEPNQAVPARKLKESIMNLEAATEACRRNGFKEGTVLDACVSDVMATGDMDAAQAGLY